MLLSLREVDRPDPSCPYKEYPQHVQVAADTSIITLCSSLLPSHLTPLCSDFLWCPISVVCLYEEQENHGVTAARTYKWLPTPTLLLSVHLCFLMVLYFSKLDEVRSPSSLWTASDAAVCVAQLFINLLVKMVNLSTENRKEYATVKTGRAKRIGPHNR